MRPYLKPSTLFASAALTIFSTNAPYPRPSLASNALARSPHTSSTQSAWRVGLWDVGPIRYGMSLAEASAALHERLQVPPARPDDRACWSALHPKAAPPGVSLIVMQGTIERVDVDSPGIPTTEGAQVGWTVSQLKQVYGDTMEVAFSLGAEPEFWVHSTDAARLRLMIFVAHGERIVSYRAGRSMAVQLEECA